MGQFFSDAVETALRYIYYEERNGGPHGQEGFRLLEQASEAGDGDADCVLARCLSGPQYVWSGHGFPEDDDRATALYKRAVKRGSALGVLVAKRSGMLTRQMLNELPFSLQDAYAQVEAKAAGGDPFCQYVIGNVYFWWDFQTIYQKGKYDFSSEKEYSTYMTENILKCEDWFWRAFRGGMRLAGTNLRKFYREGDDGFVPPCPEKADEVLREGAELGYSECQYYYAGILSASGDNAGFVKYMRLAAENGEPDAWWRVGNFYENGRGVEKDLAEAVRCYERAAEQNCPIGCYELGACYFYGSGVEKDRAKAYKYLSRSIEQLGGDQGKPLLAVCYLDGSGTAPDYQRAFDLAWQTKEAPFALYTLGRLYAEGLGVPQDIEKGVGFLQRADCAAARKELTHYKKSFFGFGRWVRC